MADIALGNINNSRPQSRRQSVSNSTDDAYAGIEAQAAEEAQATAQAQAAQLAQAKLLADAAAQSKDPKAQGMVGKLGNTAKNVKKAVDIGKKVALVVGNPLFWPVVGVIVATIVIVFFVVIGMNKLQDSTGVNVSDLCQRLGNTCVDQIVQQSGQALKNSSN
ncbi:MAG: hypothetical protein ABI721_01810 [Candidatus Dojkabacteria bacterium]